MDRSSTGGILGPTKFRCLMVASPRPAAPPPCLVLLGLRYSYYRNRSLVPLSCDGTVVLHVAFLGCGVQSSRAAEGLEDGCNLHHREQAVGTNLPSQQVSLRQLLFIDDRACERMFLVLHALILLWTAIIHKPYAIPCCDAPSQSFVLSRSCSTMTDTDTLPLSSHDDSFSSSNNTIWLQVPNTCTSEGSASTLSIQGVLSYLWGAKEKSFDRRSSSLTMSNVDGASSTAMSPVVLQTSEEPMYYCEPQPAKNEDRSTATLLLSCLLREEEEEVEEQQPREWSVNNIPPWSALHKSTADEMY